MPIKAAAMCASGARSPDAPTEPFDGMRERLVLGGERRRGHVRDHESGVEARGRGEEGRQPGDGRVDQQRDAPLGERADLGNREREVVGGERHRLGVEVAARERLPGLREHERIVGDAVRLGEQRRRGIVHHVEARAHDLRLATQAVGVLHLVVAVQVRGADLAALQQPPIGSRAFDLPRVSPQLVDALVEWRVAAHRRIDRERARHHRRGEDILGREEAVQRERGGDLRAVEEREPFLRCEREGREARGCETLRGRHHAIAVAHGADAHQGRGHVRERGQVARRADRALRRDARIDARVQQRHHRVDDLGPHSGETAREARHLEQHDEAHHRIVERRADADAMREDQVLLQQLELVGRDVRLRELAEAGVDAVDGPALLDDARHGARAFCKPLARGGIECHGLVRLREGMEVREREAAGNELHA
jgi:hypothetical protein